MLIDIEGDRDAYLHTQMNVCEGGGYPNVLFKKRRYV